MAKIDVSKIEGYAEMSAEDKLKALEAYEVPDPDYSGYVKKDVFDKTAKELADKKKELKDKLTAEEQAADEAKEKQEAMEKELNDLRRESTISKTKAKYLSLGYDEKLAEETAQAVADGDTEKVFANEKKHLADFEKQIRADALKNSPRPDGGQGGNTMTLEKFRKLSPAERLQFSEEHTDEYKAMYDSQDAGGNE